jgi:hypothetical protein
MSHFVPCAKTRPLIFRASSRFRQAEHWTKRKTAGKKILCRRYPTIVGFLDKKQSSRK